MTRRYVYWRTPEGKRYKRQDNKHAPAGAFIPAFAGERTEYRIKIPTKASCDHALIVNTLAEQLTHPGFAVYSDQLRDLYTVDASGRIEMLLEAKPDVAPYSILAVVGR